jgi:hypothetical protein
MFGVVKTRSGKSKRSRALSAALSLVADGPKEEWRGLKVPGHVDDVLKAVKALKSRLNSSPRAESSSDSCIITMHLSRTCKEPIKPPGTKAAFFAV